VKFKPSGLTLFSDDPLDHTPPPPPVRKSPLSASRRDFDSGFKPEFVLRGVSALGAPKCAKCSGKVFGFCRLETPEGTLFHADCFRCAACKSLLGVKTFGWDGEGALACLKHAAKR